MITAQEAMAITKASKLTLAQNCIEKISEEILSGALEGKSSISTSSNEKYEICHNEILKLLVEMGYKVAYYDYSVYSNSYYFDISWCK